MVFVFGCVGVLFFFGFFNGSQFPPVNKNKREENAGETLVVNDNYEIQGGNYEMTS